MQVVEKETLDFYGETFVEFCDEYPLNWGTLMRYEDEAREDHLGEEA